MRKSDIWEQRFSDGASSAIRFDGWITKYLPIIVARRPEYVLDLGCGAGQDSEYLRSVGLRVTYLDFSLNALRCIKQVNAARVLADISALPFRPNTFELVVSDLSLHYFHLHEMPAVLRGVADAMSKDAYLLVRVNSVNDVNHGANGQPEVIVNGELKVFYDEATFRRTFSAFHITSVDEYTTECYRLPKRVIEGLVRKED